MNANKEILAFLGELRINNNRDWFQQNKTRYTLLQKEFVREVQDVIGRIATFDAEIAGLQAKDCLFRIYRDIRFSPDKTPYKVHFSAYMAAPGGRKSDRAGYYLHLEPGRCMLSGGLWCPPSPVLKVVRKDIYENIDEFEEILNDPEFRQFFPQLEGETLKRVPAGYPADSSCAEILKHKDFCVVHQTNDSFFDSADWLDKTEKIYKKVQLLNRFLNFSVDEFAGRV